jgi:hypothetical protein
MSILPVMIADGVGLALLRAAADYRAPGGAAGREAASVLSEALGREVVGGDRAAHRGHVRGLGAGRQRRRDRLRRDDLVLG